MLAVIATIAALAATYETRHRRSAARSSCRRTVRLHGRPLPAGRDAARHRAHVGGHRLWGGGAAPARAAGLGRPRRRCRTRRHLEGRGWPPPSTRFRRGYRTSRFRRDPGDEFGRGRTRNLRTAPAPRCRLPRRFRPTSNRKTLPCRFITDSADFYRVDRTERSAAEPRRVAATAFTAWSPTRSPTVSTTLPGSKPSKKPVTSPACPIRLVET